MHPCSLIWDFFVCTRHFASLAIKNAHSEDSERLRMRRLIWIFAGRWCLKVHFLMLRLICYISYNAFSTQKYSLFSYCGSLLELPHWSNSNKISTFHGLTIKAFTKLTISPEELFYICAFEKRANHVQKKKKKKINTSWQFDLSINICQWDRRINSGDERERQGRKRNRNESEEMEEIKTFPLYPYLLQG